MSTLPDPVTTEKPSKKLLFIFFVMWFGIFFNASLSAYMLPTIIKEVNDDPRIIGYLLALNPLFGIIAQPLIGLWSDHIWTPVGRRAFFIIIAAPVIAICLVLMPAAAVLWQLFILVLFFEMCHDIVMGADNPLIADLIAPQYRMFTNGLILFGSQLGAIFMLYVGMGIIVEKYGDQALMNFGAGVQILFVMIPAFFLGEKKVEKLDRPKLTVKRYFNDIWQNIPLRRLSLTNLYFACFDNLIKAFLILFVTMDLGADKSEFGKRWFLQNVIAFILSIPVGIFVEKKVPKNMAISIGLAFEIVACVVALFADDIDDLYLIAFFFGTGFVIKNTTFKPFISEFMPKDIIGQLTGAINIFYGVGRTLVTVAGGWIVYWAGGNYRALFFFAIAAGVAGIWNTLRVKDERFAQRKAQLQ